MSHVHIQLSLTVLQCYHHENAFHVCVFYEHWHFCCGVQGPFSVCFLKCLFLRKRSWVGEGQRDRETENPKQTLYCQHGTQHGLKPTKPGDHDLSWNQSWMLNRLSHQGTPSVLCWFIISLRLFVAILFIWIHANGIGSIRFLRF